MELDSLLQNKAVKAAAVIVILLLIVVATFLTYRNSQVVENSFTEPTVADGVLDRPDIEISEPEVASSIAPSGDPQGALGIPPLDIPEEDIIQEPVVENTAPPAPPIDDTSVTDLSPEEQDLALTSVTDAFTQYYQYSSDESVEARAARLAPYITPDSGLEVSPLFTGEAATDLTGLQVYSMAEVGSSTPVSLDATTLVTLLTTVVDGQISPPAGEEGMPRIYREQQTFLVTGVRDATGTWKISKVEEA